MHLSSDEHALKINRRAISLFLAVATTASLTVACGNYPFPSGGGGDGAAKDDRAHHGLGEGGEGGEGGRSSHEDPVSYAAVLGLMKGHLLAADELMELKDYPAAEQHIGHPVEELYGDLEPALIEKNVPPFKQQLNTLVDLIQSAPTSPQTRVAFVDAQQGIDRAFEAIPELKRRDPVFVVAVIRELLDTAGSEYAAAITNGRFTETVEYQDSRGFVRYAEQLYQQIASELQTRDPELNAKLKNALKALLPVWPAPIPPAHPLKTPAQVQALIQSI
jgi:hypothetical protein